MANTGQITGYKTTIGGADTVFPFNTPLKMTVTYDIGIWNTTVMGITVYIRFYDDADNLYFSRDLYQQTITPASGGGHTKSTLTVKTPIG